MNRGNLSVIAGTKLSFVIDVKIEPGFVPRYTSHLPAAIGKLYAEPGDAHPSRFAKWVEPNCEEQGDPESYEEDPIPSVDGARAGGRIQAQDACADQGDSTEDGAERPVDGC